jgi:hypothetical protein
MVLLVTVGLVTFVCAQALAAPVAISTESAKSAPPAVSVKQPALPRIVGEVVSVDATANTITVKDKSGKSETLTLGPKVVVRKAGKTITFADVSAGDRVSVRYRTEADKKIATSIYVLAPTSIQPTKETAPTVPATQRIIGEVVSVDTTTANAIIVKDKSGKTETLTLGSKVVVRKAGKTIALTDISAGNRVSVRYITEAGKKIATSIYVLTPTKRGSPPTK